MARGAFGIITGGPGTGKTTTVVRLLALLQSLALAETARPLRIRLAAPTGKAAARLNQSIAKAIDRLPLDRLDHGAALRAAIPQQVTTLHRLLGSRPDTRQFRHDARHPLALDVLVIDEASMMIRESVSELERVNDLIGQLLGFARIENQQEAWIDIDRELTAVMNFMKQIHEHHHIGVSIATQAPHAQAMISSKHFRQILLNLLQNSRDALPEGGRIRISVQNHQNGIAITFEDDGPGIADNMFEKIFEPFYSSRRDGVGLGLAVVRNLKGHVDSNSGDDDPSTQPQVSHFPIPDPINTQQNEYGPV